MSIPDAGLESLPPEILQYIIRHIQVQVGPWASIIHLVILARLSRSIYQCVRVEHEHLMPDGLLLFPRGYVLDDTAFYILIALLKRHPAVLQQIRSVEVWCAGVSPLACASLWKVLPLDSFYARTYSPHATCADYYQILATRTASLNMSNVRIAVCSRHYHRKYAMVLASCFAKLMKVERVVVQFGGPAGRQVEPVRLNGQKASSEDFMDAQFVLSIGLYEHCFISDQNTP